MCSTFFLQNRRIWQLIKNCWINIREVHFIHVELEFQEIYHEPNPGITFPPTLKKLVFSRGAISANLFNKLTWELQSGRMDGSMEIIFYRESSIAGQHWQIFLKFFKVMLHHLETISITKCGLQHHHITEMAEAMSSCQNSPLEEFTLLDYEVGFLGYCEIAESMLSSKMHAAENFPNLKGISLLMAPDDDELEPPWYDQLKQQLVKLVNDNGREEVEIREYMSYYDEMDDESKTWTTPDNQDSLDG